MATNNEKYLLYTCNAQSSDLKTATAMIQELQIEMDEKFKQLESLGYPYKEDLTVDECGCLKFADRESDGCHDGYKILRNKCNCDCDNCECNNQAITQDDFNEPNTIYELRYCFDLDGQTITLPEGSTLRFNGGKLNNGTIICNNTDIQGINNLEDVGDVTIEGTFKEGLILSINKEPKVYKDSQWQSITVDIDPDTILTELNAEVIDVTSTTEEAKADVRNVAGTLQFTFNLPKGSKGDAGESIQGPKGEKGDPGEKGEKGDPGDVTATTRPVVAYKSSKTQPATPTGGSWDASTNTVTYPNGWSADDELTPPVWMSTAIFNSKTGLEGTWSTPVRISAEDGKDGIDGTDGSDGVKTEFIYKRYREELSNPSTERPTQNNRNIDDFVPIGEGWSDHPEGVTDTILCEYVCTRTVLKSDDPEHDTYKWGEWIGPVLWAKYGVNGKDGDGVEYVYIRTTLNITPNITFNTQDPDYQTTEYLPTSNSIFAESANWTDDPKGVTEDYPYEWVSQRKYSWSTDGWGEFSTPALWAKYGFDGKQGDPGTGIAVKGTVDSVEDLPMTDNTIGDAYMVQGNLYVWDGDSWVNCGQIKGEPGRSSFTSFVFQRTNSTPTTPTGGTYSNPFPTDTAWKDGIPDGEAQVWMSQCLFWSDNVGNGVWTAPRVMTDTSDFDVEFSSVASPGNPTSNPSNWSNTASSSTIWMATRTYKNGVWSSWQISKIKGEQGQDGDTSYVHIKFSNDGGTTFTENNGETPGKYIGLLVDYVPADSNFPDQYNWSKFQGDDGFYYEYIYQRTQEEVAPTVPTTNQQTDDYVPSGWTDDPSGINSTYKYEWQCYRVKKDGIWSEFKGSHVDPTKAVLWAVYGEGVPGEMGEQGPITYPAGYWDSSITYTGDSTKRPYVLYNGEYYILIGTSSRVGVNPATDTINWLKMDMFESIYTDILFANQALVGQAVFNGDYMFSQDGINQSGEYTSSYGNFNAADPYKSTNSFRPNYCVNFKTGEVWTGAGKINFKADGSGYLANGAIKFTSDGNFTITPIWTPLTTEMTPDIFSSGTTLNIDKYRYFDCTYDSSSASVYENLLLPSASSYPGVELHFRDIRTRFTGTSSGYSTIKTELSFRDAAKGGQLSTISFYKIPHYSQDIVIKSDGSVWILDILGTSNKETDVFSEGTTFEAVGQGVTTSSGTQRILVFPDSTIVFPNSGEYWVDAADEGQYTHCKFVILPNKSVTINSFTYSAGDVSLLGGCIIHHTSGLYYYYKQTTIAP